MSSSLSTWKRDEEVKLRIWDDNKYSSLEPETVIDAFRRTLKKDGNSEALHYTVDGKKHALTFQEYYDKSVQFGKSLLHLGLPRFGAVNIIGFNSVEWFVADVGTILAGGIAAGIYTTNKSASCKYISEHCEASVVVCEGMKQLEKFTAIASELPNLKALVIYGEKKAPDVECSVPIYEFDEFLELGKDVSDEAIEERMNDQKPGQCCTLIYTSGTTGPPKAVMISHDNITWIVRVVVDILGGVDNSDRLVSYLPLSHVAAQLIDIHAPICTGISLYFAQPDALKGSLAKTLKEVRPTVFFGVPRVFEKIAEKLTDVMNGATGPKKYLLQWAKGKAFQRVKMNEYGKSGGAPCGYGVAHSLILGKIKAALGLDACREVLSGAAPMAQETTEFFASLDIPVLNFFGQSEATGPQTWQLTKKYRLDSSGFNIEGTKHKIIEDTEEFVYQGRNIMMGYMKNEEETKKTIDEDGWLHSGDCAKIDEDGFVSITGRIKELIVTAGGENVPPVLIENILKEELPLLSHAVVIGDKRKFLTALFTLRVKMDGEDFATDELDDKALGIMKEIGSTAKTVAEAKADPHVKEYLDAGLKRANERSTSRAQNVGKYAILDRDFSLGGGEITPTLKLKRKVVLEKYADVIDEMYGVKK